MKNLNQNTEQVDSSLTSNDETNENSIYPDLNMQVYNELHDQTNSSVNVLQMIQEQFKQINEMNKRRSLLLKEVAQYIVR